MEHRGLNFGVFMGPFHRLGDNPSLAMARDLEIIEWLDHLGYDEAWIGEHHSAGWELIASPELTIVAAAERTKHIRLGSGVTSLPYHQPFLVAQRFVQLDHMTRGRVMLGCGPGALPSDAYMMGIEPVDQRRRMMESLDAIMQLLKGEEPVTVKTDWFELREARLHLAPWSDPHFEVVVASTMSPYGMMAAGRHGIGVISTGAGLPGGPEALAGHWKIAEDEAAKHGKTVSRKKWRIAINMHVAETDEQAMREVAHGERLESVSYFEDILARPPGRTEDPLGDGLRRGTTLVGSPETVAQGIERLIAVSGGGFGGIMFRTHDWANREQTLRSYELFARWVMPRFQGSLDAVKSSADFVRENSRTVLGGNVEAMRRAFTDTGRAVPKEFQSRLTGAAAAVTE
ncbi:LLM class flavin-dependent oxidoreductase [Roseococcus pinisoli]|uniref:LLM class flavin-dependent oxidoreductase n=1 Tax=Roseococcus pinisoli TaxID=2835040 RepID=A0ABS5QEA8_9PROT|nr:LLM class flavin-dependent oxidoreductase [Roseococcus pinisoli]MBS7811877.1 LLM class flavin-dependent oxidoreductase [Roseococcus pinisoli]